MNPTDCAASATSEHRRGVDKNICYSHSCAILRHLGFSTGHRTFNQNVSALKIHFIYMYKYICLYVDNVCIYVQIYAKCNIFGRSTF